MSSNVTRNDDGNTIQLGVEVSPFSDEDTQEVNTIAPFEENAGDLPDNGQFLDDFNGGQDEKDSSVSFHRSSINFSRFPSSSSSPGSTPIKFIPTTSNRINRSESSSSVIGLASLTPPSPVSTNPPSSPLHKAPPSPTIDEGPTFGVLEPEMFTGVETIVVPSEPDLTNYSAADLIPIGEEKVKFQFSSSHSNDAFHRKFPQVDPQERLINHYSCALQADILLQGYLYITENYFAFYSNILGLYKTKLLIPVCDVREITKEKIAIIIPNAVGIETHQGKYVFGSLLSRESTYRLLVEVWKNTISMDTFPFDQLRPAQEAITDNNSPPSTPTKEDPTTSFKSIVAIHSDNGLATRLVNAGLPGQSSASSSLKRSKSKRRTKGKQKRPGLSNCSDSSSPETTSDLDYGVNDDTVIVGGNLITESVKKSGYRKNKLVVDGWRRLSVTIKSLREKLKSDLSTSLLHITIIILLTYLLISTIWMIHRISSLQNLFESLTSNPKAQRILNNIQVEQIRMDLSKNVDKMDDLKSSLMNLLDSVEKVFNTNCAIQRDNPFVNPSMLKNGCPSTHSVHDEG